MAKKIGEVNLSPDEVADMVGWQKSYSPLVISVFREAISLGHEFPRADVVFVNGVYQLRQWGFEYWKDPNYGGHHRARFFHEDSLVFPCNLWENDGEDIASPVPIRDMVVRKTFYAWDGMRLLRASRYLPKESVLRIVGPFCREHNLDVENFFKRESQ